MCSRSRRRVFLDYLFSLLFGLFFFGLLYDRKLGKSSPSSAGDFAFGLLCVVRLAYFFCLVWYVFLYVDLYVCFNLFAVLVLVGDVCNVGLSSGFCCCYTCLCLFVCLVVYYFVVVVLFFLCFLSLFVCLSV